jgi:hypothetical protein
MGILWWALPAVIHTVSAEGTDDNISESGGGVEKRSL